jgi:hypothetical protein
MCFGTIAFPWFSELDGSRYTFAQFFNQGERDAGVRVGKSTLLFGS